MKDSNFSLLIELFEDDIRLTDGELRSAFYELSDSMI